jgi:hypothetical protein
MLRLLLGAALVAPAAAQQFAYVPGLLPGANRWTEGIEAIDVDGDGDLDLAVADGEGFSGPGTQRQNVLLINQLIETGSLAFTDESVARLGTNLSHAKGVAHGDVNGDGWVDILYANAFNVDPPHLYINRGAAQPGYFDMESSTRGFTENLSSAGAQFGDVDDDGDLDVIICDSGSSWFGGTGGRPRLYFNDGAGNFTEDAVAMNAPVKFTHMDVQLVDIDNDWDLDFFGANRASNSGGNHYLMLNDGSGSFTDASSSLPSTSSNVYEAEVGDLDGDTDIDLFFVSLSGFQEGHVRNDLLPSGSLGFTAGSPQPGSVDDNEIMLLDFDNDSDLDVFVASLGPRERLYQNNGGLSFTPSNANIQAVSDPSLDACIADLDNDGDYDFVTANGEGGSSNNWANKVYLNSGSADTLAPVIVALDVPAAPSAYPIVLHAKTRDQVLDDGVTYVTPSGAAAPYQQGAGATTLTGGAWSPALINVPAGGSVIFTNQNGTTETLQSDSAPYDFSVGLANGQSWEQVYVHPGSYEFTTPLTGFSGTVVVTGPATPIDALYMSGEQHRFSIPVLPASPSGLIAVELLFTDWPGNQSVADNLVLAEPGGLGVNYCGPAVPNSSGSSARISATGSPVASANSFDLVASDLPPNQFGYFLASETQGFVVGPGGSQGDLCLGGTVGRFTAQVQSSGAGGSITIPVDLTAIPTTPVSSVVAGETWNFQAWFRDFNPGATSNFSNGLSVLFQ